MNEQPQKNPYFSDISEFLQVTFEVEEYQKLVEEFGKNLLYAGEAEYTNRLPTYVVARCPFCDFPYTAMVDTHSLGPTLFYEPDFQCLFRDDWKERKCEHFVATARFINLNGELPQEYDRWSNDKGDIPVIVPTLLKEEYEAVVMHSLPMCRVEENAFVPRYLVYITTYFSTSREKSVEARWQELNNLPNIDNDLLPFLDGSFAARIDPHVADLSYWAGINKLYWLDLQTTELRTGNSDDFPYGDIDGVGKSYHYIKEHRSFWKRRRYPNGYLT